MSKTHSVQHLLLATTLLLSAAIPVAVHADDATAASGSPLSTTDRTNQAPLPGSWRAIAAVKDPSHYGPHLPAADTPSAYVPPVPGSIATIMATKDPSHFGSHPAATELATASGSASFAAFEASGRARPGSAEALILAKDPMFFKRGKAAENPK